MNEDDSGNSAMVDRGRKDDPIAPGHPLETPQEHNSSLSPLEDPVSQTFLDADGLRPIWRFFLYVAMAGAVYLLLGVGMNYAERSSLGPLWLDTLSEIVVLLSAFVPAVILARPEGRSMGEYGLPLRQAFGKLFWVGTLWGMGALTILMLGLHGVGAFNISRLALHGARILKFAVFWGGFFLLVAFAEEFMMRGYTQFTLAKAVGFWAAAFPLSAAFGAIHFINAGEGWNGVLAAAAIGLFLCLTLFRTGSLWFAIGFHAAWDWGESFLYSVPDSGRISPGHLLKSSSSGPWWLSGGSVGPEGSCLFFLVLAVIWLVFDRVYPEVRWASGRANS